MTEKEKMLAGELYDCGDAELLALWHRAKDLARDYNLTNSSDTKRKSELLNELLGKVGNQLWITPPFHVDYGCNIYFGNNCEVNMNCTFLDDNKIIIGDNVLIAPNVQIYTAYHPTHYLDRFTISENETFNFCKTQTAPVIIGKNVFVISHLISSVTFSNFSARYFLALSICFLIVALSFPNISAISVIFNS